MVSSSSEKTKPADEGSTLAPFRHPAFTVPWLATVVSNVGVWTQNAAAGWLVTGLTSDPFLVKRIFSRLAVGTRAEAVSRAGSLGLL